ICTLFLACKREPDRMIASACGLHYARGSWQGGRANVACCALGGTCPTFTPRLLRGPHRPESIAVVWPMTLQSPGMSTLALARRILAWATAPLLLLAACADDAVTPIDDTTSQTDTQTTTPSTSTGPVDHTTSGEPHTSSGPMQESSGSTAA